MLEFYWPVTNGEWLAFVAAAATVVIGLAVALHALLTSVPVALIERGHLAGMLLGLGTFSILMAQPFVYFALGAGWAFAAVLQVAVALRHRRLDAFGLGRLLVAVVLAAMPIAYGFGLA